MFGIEYALLKDMETMINAKEDKNMGLSKAEIKWLAMIQPYVAEYVAKGDDIETAILKGMADHTAILNECVTGSDRVQSAKDSMMKKVWLQINMENLHNQVTK